jgi:outer membrane protein OmpA-like peptidoglycan-associated protein
MQMRLSLSVLALALALLFAGCAGVTTPGAPGTTPGGAAPPPAALPTLVSEQRRLADELQGTPVVVETTADGRLRVAVPLEFCFDHGRSAVKKPLAAVLDRIATGLRRQPAFDVRVAAPSDAKGAGGRLLAQDRAASTRDYLVARGVPVARFVHLASAGDADGVEVVIGDRTAAH